MRQTSGVAACAEAWLPYRHLAVRVIDQALRDAVNLAEPPTSRESARAFLAGSRMLSLWCEVADLDPRWMVARAARLIGQSYEAEDRVTDDRRLDGARVRYRLTPDSGCG